MIPRGRPLIFGRNLETRNPFAIDPKRLSMHTLIVGGTGSGKTVSLESLARQAIAGRCSLIFLDPKGTVYHRLVNYCRRLDVGDRLHLIDPNDERYRVGVNYFDLAVIPVEKQVDLVIEAIYRVMGQTEEIRVTFERWGGVALRLLADSGLTLADFHSILLDEDLRHAAIQRTKDQHVLREWENFEGINHRDQFAQLQASVNRAALFSKDHALYEMTGLPNAIDWQQVMNNRGIVLVNLAPRVATEHLSRFVGIMLIHQIYHAALARPQKFWSTPCYLIVDEFAPCKSYGSLVSVLSLPFRTPATCAR
jgi:hypothetical protein